MSTYKELLRHPKWQKKRLLILERDNFTCRYCQDNETELHIHHLKYHKTPWDAKDEDLLTLCKDCHQLVTAYDDLDKIISISKNPNVNGDLMFYVKNTYEGQVFIEVIGRREHEHTSLIRFKQNGIGINILINLNNG